MTTARRRRQRSRRIVTVSIFSTNAGSVKLLSDTHDARFRLRASAATASPLIGEMDRTINLTFHGVGEPLAGGSTRENPTSG